MLIALLVLAYATGEEFQHTYMLIAWGGAAVLVTALYWELVRPHSARFADQLFGRRFIQAMPGARAPKPKRGAEFNFGNLHVSLLQADYFHEICTHGRAEMSPESLWSMTNWRERSSKFSKRLHRRSRALPFCGTRIMPIRNSGRRSVPQLPWG
jgi:hypothetical protein